MSTAPPLIYEDALEVIHRLLDVARERHEPFVEPIVMVGGTAMMAQNLPARSRGVALYAADFSEAAVHQVEREFREKFGDDFKIDVTSTENLG